MRKYALLLAAVSVCSSILSAATVEVDGKSVTTLSAAISQAQAADDGPHIINIKVDALPTADSEIIISEPMTINGDADGNGKKCDILVDVAAIQKSAVTEEMSEKAYIKLHSPGSVVINDLKIHPNQDGTKAAESELVDCFRLFCPPAAKDVAKYDFNRVWISGSDSANKYVPLDTAENLYEQPGIKMWSRQVPMGNRGIIHCANRKKSKNSTERGEYQLTLNDCHAGLGRGVVVNFTATGGSHTINGGVYGHCGTDAIRIAGHTISLTGSSTNRLRVIRAANYSAAKTTNQLITVTPKAQTQKIEFVDLMPNPGAVASLETILPASISTSQKENRLISDQADMAVVIKGGDLPEAAPFKGWLTPEAAWAQAQAEKKSMVLVFQSPQVGICDSLCKLMETNRAARNFLSKCSVGRVNVSEVEGQKIAQKYGIYKIPAILMIASDAKSYQRITPTDISSWAAIEAELTKK